MVARVLALSAMLLVACDREPPSGCPSPGTEVAVTLFGSSQGTGALIFEGPPLVARLRVGPSSVGSTNVGGMDLAGPCTCEHGVLRARLSGGADPKVGRVFGAVLEGLYQPRLVAFEVVAAWRADYADPNGLQGTIAGYLAGVSPEDLRQEPR